MSKRQDKSDGIDTQYDAQWFEHHGVDDERIIDALTTVERRPFVAFGEGEDDPMPATSLPPMDVVAKLLSALEVDADANVLEIGTSTGYITALLAHLADHVYTVERRLPVAKLAEGRLSELELENVDVLYGPKLSEYALNAPYDSILISAIAPRIPKKLKPRLAVGGHLVVPIKKGSGNPEVICLHRADEDTFEKTSLGQLRFSSKLGDILVELGIAERDDIELAALEADVSGQKLGEALLEYSHVQEEDLVRALAIQRGFNVAPINTLLEIADHELSYSVPRAFLKHHQIIPLAVNDGELMVATVDPDAPAIELARLLEADSIETYLVTANGFQRIWNTILEGRQPAVAQEDNLKTRVEAKFETILRAATRLQATTIHVDNQPDGGKIRFRIGDGLRNLPEMAFEPAEVSYLIEFLKLGSGLDPLEEKVPQRGRFSWVREPVTYHLHVHVMPSIVGEQLSVQLLSHGADPPSLEDLGFPDYVVENIEVLLEHVEGVFLIVGPRHAPKKETLYALLSHFAEDESRKVGTIETDILCPIPDVQQVLVRPEEDFGYRAAIPEFLRFDVDVLGLDELPNTDVAMDALAAARRGPMLLATMHGKDGGNVLEELREFGVPPEALANGISGILTQWIAPRICEECREPIDFDRSDLDVSFPGEAPNGFKAYRGAGCHACDQTGTDGTIPVVELIPFGDSMRKAIIANKSEETLRRIAAKSGVEMLPDYALRLVSAGKIPFDELINYASLDR